MRILIATGIYPPRVGGPSYYAASLEREFRALGHDVSIATYTIERSLPLPLRYIVFFVRVWIAMVRAEAVIALDTMSVGFPTVLAGKLLRTRVIIRTGGDFLWETYVNRTRHCIPLSRFYEEEHALNAKERMIRSLTSWTLRNATSVVFSTRWQRDIFVRAYGLAAERTGIVENLYERPNMTAVPEHKEFIWAGRDIPLKQKDLLMRAVARAALKDPSVSLSVIAASHEELLGRIGAAYAVVLPTVSEVSPNFILESISQGKPFVCTADNGLMDRIGELGIFHAPCDEDALADAILRLSEPRTYDSFRARIAAFPFVHSYRDIANEMISIIHGGGKDVTISEYKE